MPENEIQEILKSVSNNISNLEIDQLKEDLRVTKYKLQEINDSLEGGLRSFNLKEMRNTYVINSQDSLDVTYPMYVDFNIVSEMTKIVSIFVYFRIMNYRAYSTAAKSGGGSVSGSGGGQTSSVNSGYVNVIKATGWATATNVGNEGRNGILLDNSVGLQAVGSDGHTHTVTNHTHTTPNHIHDITYGIHEESNSPTIKFYVSEDNGVSFSDVFGPYKKSQTGGIEITTFLEGIGNKLLKFESDLRTRLSVQIIVKLDIKVR